MAPRLRVDCLFRVLRSLRDGDHRRGEHENHSLRTGIRLVKDAVVENANGHRTFVIVLQTGNEVMSVLKEYATSHHLRGSHFTAIGACSDAVDAVVAYFDWQSKRYQEIAVAEQVGVLSLIGDIAMSDDGPKIRSAGL